MQLPSGLGLLSRRRIELWVLRRKRTLLGRANLREARLYCAALTAIAVGAATSCIDAQTVEIQGAPVVVRTLERQMLAPFSSTAAAPQNGILVIGGATRQQLFLLGADGRARAEVGDLTRLGAKLGLPVAAVFEDERTVRVLDGQSAGWATLKVHEGRWRLSATGLVPLSGVSGMCVSGNGSTYVMAKHDDVAGVIHLLGPRGTISKSFGLPFQASENPAIEHGHIACARSTSAITISSRLYPEVRTYSQDGRLLWTTSVSDFKPVEFETSGRRISFVYPADSTWDEIVSLFSPNAQVMAVQIARRRGLPGLSRYLSLRTVFLSLGTGARLGVQPNMPEILQATPSHLVGHEAQSVGDLRVYSYRYVP